MSTFLTRRPFILVAAASAVLVFAASGCVSGRDGGDATAAATPATTIVAAPINKVDVLVRESAPPGYTAHIVSGLPSGCARFHSAEITGQAGNTITIGVKNTMPADANTVCTAIYGYHETNVDLGTDFAPRQQYIVLVNDKSATFTTQ